LFVANQILKGFWVRFLQDSGCAYTDDLDWYTRERAALSCFNSGRVFLEAKKATAEYKVIKSKGKTYCPFNSPCWTVFNICFQVQTWLFFGSIYPYTMDNYYVSKPEPSNTISPRTTPPGILV
jgi:hypothetical protein